MSPLLPLKSAYETAIQRLNEVEGKLSNLPIPIQTFLLVYSAQGVIDNGGFQFFFEMDWPENPEYQVFSNAYCAIGADDAARCIDMAVSLFDFDNPEKFETKRMQFLQALPEDHDFFKFGDSVCGDSSIWHSLSIYVNQHKHEFQCA